MLEKAGGFEQGWEGGPAAPEGDPAGEAVAGAVLVAAEAGEGEAEVVDAEGVAALVEAPQAEDEDGEWGEQVAGGAGLGVGLAGGVAEVQEVRGGDRY